VSCAGGELSRGRPTYSTEQLLALHAPTKFPTELMKMLPGVTTLDSKSPALTVPTSPAEIERIWRSRSQPSTRGTGRGRGAGWRKTEGRVGGRSDDARTDWIDPGEATTGDDGDEAFASGGLLGQTQAESAWEQFTEASAQFETEKGRHGHSSEPVSEAMSWQPSDALHALSVSSPPPSVSRPAPLDGEDSAHEPALTPSKDVDPAIAGARWFYVDMQGREQGPFSTSAMREWHTSGFFADSLMVRCHDVAGMAFAPLSGLFPDHATAFTFLPPARSAASTAPSHSLPADSMGSTLAHWEERLASLKASLGQMQQHHARLVQEVGTASAHETQAKETAARLNTEFQQLNAALANPRALAAGTMTKIQQRVTEIRMLHARCDRSFREASSRRSEALLAQQRLETAHAAAVSEAREVMQSIQMLRTRSAASTSIGSVPSSIGLPTTTAALFEAEEAARRREAEEATRRREAEEATRRREAEEATRRREAEEVRQRLDAQREMAWGAPSGRPSSLLESILNAGLESPSSSMAPPQPPQQPQQTEPSIAMRALAVPSSVSPIRSEGGRPSLMDVQTRTAQSQQREAIAPPPVPIVTVPIKEQPVAPPPVVEEPPKATLVPIKASTPSKPAWGSSGARSSPPPARSLEEIAREQSMIEAEKERKRADALKARLVDEQAPKSLAERVAGVVKTDKDTPSSAAGVSRQAPSIAEQITAGETRASKPRALSTARDDGLDAEATEKAILSAIGGRSAGSPSGVAWGSSGSGNSKAGLVSLDAVRKQQEEEEKIRGASKPSSTSLAAIVGGGSAVPRTSGWGAAPVSRPTARPAGPSLAEVMAGQVSQPVAAKPVAKKTGWGAASKPTSSISAQIAETVASAPEAEKPAPGTFWDEADKVTERPPSPIKPAAKPSGDSESGMSSELRAWCASRLQEIRGDSDTGLIDFCFTLSSDAEVREYFTTYLGASSAARAFCEEFLARKDFEVGQGVVVGGKRKGRKKRT
jgi:hypothetical protein